MSWSTVLVRLAELLCLRAAGATVVSQHTRSRHGQISPQTREFFLLGTETSPSSFLVGLLPETGTWQSVPGDNGVTRRVWRADGTGAQRDALSRARGNRKEEFPALGTRCQQDGDHT